MKKFLCIMITCILILGLTACTKPPDNPAGDMIKIRIGISVYDGYDTFISLITERFNHYIKEKESTGKYSFTILLESADGSQVTQNHQVDNFLNAGCDILCVNLVDRTDVSSIINKAESSGTPILFFNRELVKADVERYSDLYYVGADALPSGQRQGQIVADLFRADSKRLDKNDDGILQYVMLEGEAGHQDAIIRTESSIETLTNADIRVDQLASDIANWSRTFAETKMNSWLDKYGYPPADGNKSIEVIFSNNDSMALGAIDALEKAKIDPEKWPVIVGIDGTPDGLEAVKSGKMAGTVFNDADGQAQALVELACFLYTGLDLPSNIPLNGKYILLPYRTITPDNVQKYIDLYAK